LGFYFEILIENSITTLLLLFCFQLRITTYPLYGSMATENVGLESGNFGFLIDFVSFLLIWYD